MKTPVPLSTAIKWLAHVATFPRRIPAQVFGNISWRLPHWLGRTGENWNRLERAYRHLIPPPALIAPLHAGAVLLATQSYAPSDVNRKTPRVPYNPAQFLLDLSATSIKRLCLTRYTSSTLFAGLCAASIVAQAPASYTAVEAAKHVGETATITDKVDRVQRSGNGNIFLNMGGKSANQVFTAFIPSASSAQFSQPQQYEGRTVTISGKIVLYRGKPEIVVTSPSQIKTELQSSHPPIQQPSSPSCPSTLVNTDNLTLEEQALVNKGATMEMYKPDEHSRHFIAHITAVMDGKTGKTRNTKAPDAVICFVFGMEDAEPARTEGRSMAEFHYHRSQAEQFLFAQGWDKYHDRFFTRCYVQEGEDAFDRKAAELVQKAASEARQKSL